MNKGISALLPPLSGSITTIEYSGGSYPWSFNLSQLYRLKSPLDNETNIFCDSSNDIDLGFYQWYHCTKGQCKWVNLSFYSLVCVNSDDALNLALYRRTISGLAWIGFSFNYGDTLILKIDSNYIKLVTYFQRVNVNNYLNRIPSISIYGFDFERQIVQGCDTVFKIPIKNIDNDVVRCRNSVINGTYGRECITCDTSRYYLDQKTCTLIFPSTLDEDVLVEIQVEDFAKEIDVNPMSSTSLKIYGKLIPNKNRLLCGEEPKFTDQVPPQDSCISIDSNETLSGVIEADVPALPSSINNYKIVVKKSFPEFDYGETVLNKNLM